MTRRRFTLTTIGLSVILAALLIGSLLNYMSRWKREDRELMQLRELREHLIHEGTLLLPIYVENFEKANNEYRRAHKQGRELFLAYEDRPQLNRLGDEAVKALKYFSPFQKTYEQFYSNLELQLDKLIYHSAQPDSLFDIKYSSLDVFYQKGSVNTNERAYLFFLEFQILKDIQMMNRIITTGAEMLGDSIMTLESAVSRRRERDWTVLVLLLSFLLVPLTSIIVSNINSFRADKKVAQAKSQFFSTVSHELRTPLNVIIGLLHLMKKERLPARQKERLDKIDKSSQNLLTLINDVLDFSKLEAEKMVLESKPYSPEKLLKHTQDMFESQASAKGLALTCHSSGDLPAWLYGDAFRLQQILSNLVSNAIKFTHEGTVAIGASLLSKRNNKAWISFSVSDTGIGISPEDQKKLFLSFSQINNSVSRRYGGTGLGLSISRQLANLMGGHISVKNRKDRGSIFTLEIPSQLVSPKEEEALDARERGDRTDEVIHYPGSHGLIIDDHPVNREIITELLNSLEIKVTTAQNGKEGIETWQKGTFDIIFMDIQMPVMDGLEATKRIRKLESGDEYIPIIAMTANAMKEDRDKSIRAGMDGHLSKPLQLDALYSTLQSYLKGYSQKTRPPGDEFPDKSDFDVLQEQLPMINVREALNRLNGNSSVFLDLLNDAVSGSSDKIEIIMEKSGQGDFAAAREICHSLRGPLSNLGAEKMVFLLTRVEEDLMADTAPGEKLWNEFMDMLEEINEKLPSATKMAKPEDGDTIFLLGQALELGNPRECALLISRAEESNLITVEKAKEMKENLDVFNFAGAREIWKSLNE